MSQDAIIKRDHACAKNSVDSSVLYKYAIPLKRIMASVVKQRSPNDLLQVSLSSLLVASDDLLGKIKMFANMFSDHGLVFLS